MILESREDLAKLHCLHRLFGGAEAPAPHIIAGIKDAIEASLKESGHEQVTLEAFTEAALKLARANPFNNLSYGIFHLNLAGRGFDPLFVREELVAGLRRIAGYAHALIVVSGLHDAVNHSHRPQRGGPTRDRAAEDAVSWIDETARQWKTESTELTILYI